MANFPALLLASGSPSATSFFAASAESVSISGIAGKATESVLAGVAWAKIVSVFGLLEIAFSWFVALVAAEIPSLVTVLAWLISLVEAGEVEAFSAPEATNEAEFFAS